MKDARYLVVAIDDGYSAYDQEQAILSKAGARFEVRACRGDEDAVSKAVVDADVVLVRESPVSRKVIQAMRHCKGVIRYGIGVDNIDFQAAGEKQIAIINVPDYGIEEVSTHAVSLLLSVMRQTTTRDKHLRNGQWTSNAQRPMFRLRGRTLGLIGYGKIARQMQEKLNGFGFARVMVFDPHAILGSDVVPASIDDICREADVISLHAPLNDQTRHLINRERLSVMKANAILINTARGGLIDQSALVCALETGQILGAGLDVLEQEPPNPNDPILKLENVVVSDHIGWYSEEAMRDLQRKAAEEAARVLNGLRPLHQLN